MPETAPLTSPGATTCLFAAGAGPGSVTFQINGFLTMDGSGNCCTDIFRLTLNNIDILVGSYNLGGGGSNNTIVAPPGSTIAASSPGFGLGGVANFTVPLTLVQGSNSLQFFYNGVFQASTTNTGPSRTSLSRVPRFPRPLPGR